MPRTYGTVETTDLDCTSNVSIKIKIKMLTIQDRVLDTINNNWCLRFSIIDYAKWIKHNENLQILLRKTIVNIEHASILISNFEHNKQQPITFKLWNQMSQSAYVLWINLTKVMWLVTWRIIFQNGGSSLKMLCSVLYIDTFWSVQQNDVLLNSNSGDW